MNNEVMQRLAKVRELMERGATEGERQAARQAMDRLVKKYNIPEDQLELLGTKVYVFKWKMHMDVNLMLRLCDYFKVHKPLDSIYTGSRKEIHLRLGYLDYVSISCAYEYFRSHMADQWKKYCTPVIRRKKKAKTKKQALEALKPAFMSKYFIASGLYHEAELITVRPSEMSAKEREAYSLTRPVEGGKYNRQLTNGLLLE